MTDVDLLIIFNHRHAEVLSRVVDYNTRFTDQISVAAPFSAPGVMQYSSGVYLAQGALVEYLARLDKRTGYTLVIHDDLVLNPATRLADLVPDGEEIVRVFRTALIRGEMNPTWYWQLGVLAPWFTPRSNTFGTGVNNPKALMTSSALYQENRAAIEALGVSRLTIGQDPGEISAALAGWIEAYCPGRREFTFGVPLFYGNADYLLFPNSQAEVMEDFLRRTIECRLISEVAVPTLVNWLGLPLHFDSDRQVLDTGLEWNADITSARDIERLFAERPELLSVHPVKFSRFVDL